MSDAASSPLQNCPKCGAPLAGGDPSVPCPACLMKLGLESWTGGQSESGSRIAATPTQAAASFDAPTPEEIAGFFPQLEILELLGQGGMGAVYKARQKNLDRLVALKIIRPDVHNQAGFDERFRREAKTLARLNHPHIVTVHDFGQAGGLYYLLMEYVDGVNLRQSLRKGHLAPAEALAIVPPLCDALQYAHDEGIVHRDIKPENILLDRKGRVKIADFGLAKLVGVTGESQGLTKSRQVMGTWHYMAPEQMQGTRDVDHRADIYSLGVILYEMLTGELPIGRFAPPSQKVQVDVRLDRVVLRALESDPELRYQSAGDVRTDLTSVSSSEEGDPDRTRDLPGRDSRGRRTEKPEFSVAQRIVIGVGMLIGFALVMIPPWKLTFEGGETQAYYAFLFSPPTGNFVTNNGASWVQTQSIQWELLLLELALVGLATWGVVWLLTPSAAQPRELPSRDDGPRYSRKAIWGAVWMATILVIPVTIMPTSVEPYDGLSTDSSRENQKLLLGIMALVLAPGVTSIIGAPLLGLMAIGDIRREPKRLHGLPLALVDALLLPLLLLNGLLAWAIYEFFAEIAPEGGARSASIVVALIVCISVTLWLARWAWRAASSGLNGDDRTVVRLAPVVAAPHVANPKAAIFAVATMLVVSLLIVGAGVALFGLAFVLSEPGTQEFWGYIGGGFGCFFGGLGSTFGCWNSYRQIEGAPDLMSVARWTWLDRCLLIYGLAGIVGAVTGGFLYNRVATEGTGSALLLLGGLAAVQGLGFTAYRTLARRAGRDVPTGTGSSQ